MIKADCDNTSYSVSVQNDDSDAYPDIYDLLNGIAEDIISGGEIEFTSEMFEDLDGKPMQIDQDSAELGFSLGVYAYAQTIYEFISSNLNNMAVPNLAA